MKIIKAPESFFKTCEEGFNKDYGDIEKYYDDISSTSNFYYSDFISNEKKIMCDKMMESIIYSRSVLLLYMSLQPEYLILNDEAPSILLEKTALNAVKFSGSSQKKVYDGLTSKVSFFAQLIRYYFSVDVRYLFSFSWSTFPSMYGYFTTDYFLKCGFEFILEFLTSPSTADVQIVDSLLPPYFMCAFEFSSKFWSKVSYGLSQKVGKQNEVFEFMIGCISSCSIFLSQYHKSIIDKLYAEAPNRCITFLFTKFLRQSFEIFSRNDDYLFSSSMNELVYNFFAECLRTTLSDKAKIIINAFIIPNKNENPIELSIGVPNLPDSNEISQLNLFISPFDIGLLSEIYSYNYNNNNSKVSPDDFKYICRPEYFTESINQDFRKGFSPMRIYRTNQFKWDDTKDEINFSDEYKKFWLTVVNRADKVGMEPMEFYSRNKLKNDANNENYSKFVLLNQIHYYESNYNRLKRHLFIEKVIHENDFLIESIQSFLPPLIKKHCEISGERRKVQSNEIGGIVLNEFKIDSPETKIDGYSYIKFSTFLDSFDIEPCKIHLELTKKFLNIIEKNKDQIQNSMIAHRKIKRIISNLCERFKCIFEWKLFGRRFNAILRFVEDFETIYNELCGGVDKIKPKDKIHFKYALCVFDNELIFDAYIIVKSIITKNKDLLALFDEKVQKNFKLFELFMSMFLKDFNFYARCLTYFQEEIV